MRAWHRRSSPPSRTRSCRARATAASMPRRRDGWLARAVRPWPTDASGAIRRVKLPPGRSSSHSPSICASSRARSPAMTAPSSTTCVARTSKRRSSPAASGCARTKERAQQLMADPLFEIGNHSEAHRNLRLLEGAQAAQRGDRPAARLRGDPRTARPIAVRGAAARGHAERRAAPDAVPLSLRRLQRARAARGARSGPARHPMGHLDGRSDAAAVGCRHRARHEPRASPDRSSSTTPTDAAGTRPPRYRSPSPSCAIWASSSSPFPS